MPPTLTLASEEQKLERDRVTFPEWGARLSLPQYLERERALRAHPFSRGMRTWLLTDGPEVLASCETYDNRSQVGPHRGVSWSIASVYVEERHRRRGHATRLMDLLAEEAARREVQACVLFSDVGTAIYERAGFQVLPDLHDWVLGPREGEVPACDLWVPVVSEPPAGELVLQPSLEQLDWALERERLYARFLSRVGPSVHSAQAGAARATWAAYFKANELIILWLSPGTPDETLAVLNVARAEAHRCGLGQVRLWAVPGAPLPQGASQQKRKDELPMLRQCGRHQIVTWREVQRALWV